jgi:hypothetical protein
MSGTPAVAFYAQDVPGSDPKRWGPRDSKSRVIYKPIGQISVLEVFDCLKGLLDFHG